MIVNDTPDDMSNPGGAMRFAPPNPIYQYPTAGNEEVESASMQQQHPAASTSSKLPFYDSIYNEPCGSPPAYSSM